MSDLFLGADPAANPVTLCARMANRHGLVAGATGTGKTVTLQIMAEGFSGLGVPVFLADVKGDLSGLAAPGQCQGKLAERARTIGLDPYEPAAVPVRFWDLFGHRGLPLRASISEMGPLLLSQLLELNDTQEGILYAAFRIADDEELLLLDLKDLRALLTFMAEQRRTLSRQYGNLSTTSIAAIQRRLLVLESDGAAALFGEPALVLDDLLQQQNGRGIVNVLDATVLMSKPRLYSTFLLWLLAELFEQLPEVGDPQVPRLVFFFDEAHLLFDTASRALGEKIEQVVRLIRSKGIGVYFVTQSPTDLPEDVLGQLGNRVQHALRAYTRKDRRAVKAAADTFRPNPTLDTASVITELGLGEALVSTLDAKGVPQPVARTLIRPPGSQLGPLTTQARELQIADDPLRARYAEAIDRESAYERLAARAEAAVESMDEAPAPGGSRQRDRAARRRRSPPRRGDSLTTSTLKSAARSIGTQLGRHLVRGLLGALRGRR